MFYKTPDPDTLPSLSQPPPLSVAAPSSTYTKTLAQPQTTKLTPKKQQLATPSPLAVSKSQAKLTNLASQAATISKLRQRYAPIIQRQNLIRNQPSTSALVDYNSPLLTHLLRAAHQQEAASASMGLAGLSPSAQRLHALRLSSEPEQLPNPLLSHTISSSLAANFGNIAAANKPSLNDYHVRTQPVAAPIFTNQHFGMPAIRTKRSTMSNINEDQQSETEFIRPGMESILPYTSEDSSKKEESQDSESKSSEISTHRAKDGTKNSESSNGTSSNNDNDLLKSEASGYFAFDDEDPELASLFNLDNSFDKPSPSPMKTPFSLTSTDRRARKRRPQTYFPAATPNTKQNYGILGSGNFEIIRGGIYSDDEAKSGSDTHYARGMSETVKSSNNDFDEYNEATVNSKAPYSTEEYFSNNPVLGFQGYDNFRAASNTQKKIAPNGGSRRESTASDSSENLHVFVDHELMTAS